MEQARWDEARERLESRSQSGTGTVSDELLSALRDEGSPTSLDWACALEAQSVLIGTLGPNPAPLLHEATDDTHAQAAEALLPLLGRLYLLRFDASGLSWCLGFQERLAHAFPSPKSVVGAALSRAWLAWLTGDGGFDDHAFESASKAARRACLATIVVELQVVRALHALSAGELERATGLARRASRMAQTERLPDAEVLSALCLSRVRRLQGRAPFALRILSGVSPHAPPVWRPWIEWEALASGGSDMLARGIGEPLGNAVRAARLGDDTLTHAEMERLHAVTEGLAPLRRDADAAAALLLSRNAPRMTPWRSGVTPDLPQGLSGLAFLRSCESDADPTSVCSHVMVFPDGKAYRVPAVSVSLESRRHGASTTSATPPTQPRTDTGLSVLGLAGGSLELEDYFQRVYGYAYDTPHHATLFSMHIHRMRARVEGLATLERDAVRLTLRASTPFLLRDPRSEEPLPQRVLRQLASGGAQSARDLARVLKVPLRTLQRVLKELVVEEGLAREQQGRVVVYQVEDTTFSEPTRSRRFGSVELVPLARS
ncbi:MAG: hypothetical protein AB8I08_34405 [Sandaracinaceae bacterium]